MTDTTTKASIDAATTTLRDYPCGVVGRPVFDDIIRTIRALAAERDEAVRALQVANKTLHLAANCRHISSCQECPKRVARTLKAINRVKPTPNERGEK